MPKQVSFCRWGPRYDFVVSRRAAADNARSFWPVASAHSRLLPGHLCFRSWSVPGRFPLVTRLEPKLDSRPFAAFCSPLDEPLFSRSRQWSGPAEPVRGAHRSGAAAAAPFPRQLAGRVSWTQRRDLCFPQEEIFVNWRSPQCRFPQPWRKP